MASQNCYWDDAGSDEDWQAAGNWYTETEADRVPLADDKVIFDARMVTAPAEGMLDSESGAAAQGSYDLLHFKSGYTGGVATAAEPLCCAPEKIIIEGTGTYHIMCGETNQTTDADIPITIINNKDAIVYLYSNANSATNLAEFTDVYLISGTLYIAWQTLELDIGCYVKNLYMSPKNNSPGEATVDIDKDCYDELNDVPTNVYMQNGTLTADCQIGTFDMLAGTTTYGDSASAETVLDITTLRLYGGTLNWQPNEAAATITTAHLFGGTLNGGGSTNSANGKVITTTYLYTGATLDASTERGNVTLTNLYKFGGTLTLDKSAKIAVTYNQP